jgi:hypothetical protein
LTFSQSDFGAGGLNAGMGLARLSPFADRLERRASSAIPRGRAIDGNPAQTRCLDPYSENWSADLIGVTKMQLLGYIEAVSEEAAIERAAFSRPPRFDSSEKNLALVDVLLQHGADINAFQGGQAASVFWIGFDAGAGCAID